MVSSHGGLFVRMVLGVLVLMLVPSARAQAPTLRWTKSWKECVDLAKTESRSIFVCFTGLQWDPGSPDFLKKVVQDEAVAKVIGDMYVAIHYDLPMKPDRKVSAEAAAEGRELAKRFGLHGVHCLPRVLLVTKDERVYGRVGPVGGPDEFLRWVREWEEARVATEVAPVDAAEADRCTREAIAALNLKNPTKGLEWARQAIAANAASPSARYVMGNILLDMGQHGPARQHYMAALAIDSTGNPRDAATSTSTAGSWFNLAAIESREKREAAMVFCWRENQRTDWRTNGPVERMMDFHTQKSKPEFCLEEFEEMMSRSRFSPTWIERYLTLSEAITKGK